MSVALSRTASQQSVGSNRSSASSNRKTRDAATTAAGRPSVSALSLHSINSDESWLLSRSEVERPRTLARRCKAAVCVLIFSVDVIAETVHNKVWTSRHTGSVFSVDIHQTE